MKGPATGTLLAVITTIALTAACASDDTAPAPAPQGHAGPAATTTTPSPDAPTSTRAPVAPTTAPLATIAKGRPKKVDGADACALLRSEDLAFLGGTTGTVIRDDVIPASCGHHLVGADTDKAVLGVYKPLDQVRGQWPDGSRFDTNGYDTWLTCSPADKPLTCTAALAVRGDRTLVTFISKRDTPKNDLIDALHQLTLQALRRLPDDTTG